MVQTPACWVVRGRPSKIAERPKLGVPGQTNLCSVIYSRKQWEFSADRDKVGLWLLLQSLTLMWQLWWDIHNLGPAQGAPEAHKVLWNQWCTLPSPSPQKAPLQGFLCLHQPLHCPASAYCFPGHCFHTEHARAASPGKGWLHTLVLWDVSMGVLLTSAVSICNSRSSHSGWGYPHLPFIYLAPLT